MDEKPTTAAQPKPRRWHQYTLRTLLIAVVLLGVLFRQWPWVEWKPPSLQVVGRDNYVYNGGRYVVPTRVWIVAGIEAGTLVGWIIWRRLRRLATHS